MYLRPSSNTVSRQRSLQVFKSAHRRPGVHHSGQREVVCRRPSRTRGVASALAFSAANHLRLAAQCGAIAETTNINSAYCDFTQSNQNAVGAPITLAW